MRRGHANWFFQFAVSAVVVLFMQSCGSNTSARLTAHISLHSTEPGTARIELEFTHLRADVPIAFRFYLPDEVMLLRDVRASGDSLQSIRETEPHSNSVYLHFTSYVVSSDHQGRVSLSYLAAIGKKIDNGHIQMNGPRYGYADQTTVVTSLDYLFPHPSVNSQLLSIDYVYSLNEGGYEKAPSLNRASGVMAQDGHYHNLLVLGPFRQIPEAQSEQSTVIFWAKDPAAAKPVESFYKDQISSVSHLFPASSSRRTLIILPEAGLDAVYPMEGSDTLALDLLPFTPERAYRLTEATLLSVLVSDPNVVRHFRVGEAWLPYSLANYYAYRALVNAQLMNGEQLIYDRAGSGPGQVPLSQLLSQYKTTQSYVLEAKAFPVLSELDTRLQQKGSSLDRLVYGYVHLPMALPFRLYLVYRLGWRSGNEFWKDYVLARTIQRRDSLELTETPAPPRLSAVSGQPFRALVTNNLDGYLELCGCKVNQFGGATRRLTYLQTKLRSEKALVLDLGNFLSTLMQDAPDTAERLESRMQAEIMRRSHYDAIAVGANEVAHADLTTLRAALPAMVSANSDCCASFVPIDLGSAKAAVVGWMDLPGVSRYQNAFWTAAQQQNIHFDPARLFKLVAGLQQTYAHIIIMGYVHPLTIRELTDRFKGISVLSSYAEGEGSTELPDGYRNGNWIQFVNSGAYAVTHIVGSATRDGLVVSDVERGNLDEHVPDDPATRTLLNNFYNSKTYIKSTSSGPIQPVQHDVYGNANAIFVGTNQCQSCHQEEFQQWKTTAHGAAFATMLAKHRDHHPGCVQCHVTGFELAGGFSLKDQSSVKRMANVGCESCHGPGSEHLRAPSRDNILRSPKQDVCASCHSETHSDFPSHPTDYFAKIIHQSKQ
jgi:hypothetical protein